MLELSLLSDPDSWGKSKTEISQTQRVPFLTMRARLCPRYLDVSWAGLGSENPQKSERPELISS